MIERYDAESVEEKWQRIWADERCFEAREDKDRPKFYGLVEFPYPSGEGLHVGHARPYTAMDVIARKRRLDGYRVLFPIGYDAFGLPTENYAIKTGIHPAKVTVENVARFRAQLQRLGYSFDYSREVNTTDPDYYRWTQWIFLKFFEKGLAYKAEIPINFCTSCLVGLANEEVVDGVCERCGGAVVRKVRSQWMLRITEYAQRLIDDLDDVAYLEKIRAQQINWIGRSEGATIQFRIQGSDDSLTVFTTRPDTVFGATYMVIAPEHPLIETHRALITNLDEVRCYQQAAAAKSDFARGEMTKEKSGVALEGIRAVNPATGEDIPVWISDYVLMGYGSGAIMAVPGHDERDYDFAKTFSLPIVEVVSGGDIEKEAFTACDHGILVNSGFLNGLTVQDAIQKAIEWLEKEGLGERKVNYKLRDWVFSRQRYWGEPIPMVFCKTCGWVPLPYEQLPLKLPMLDDFSPTNDGSSCLKRATDWLRTTCPKCGGPAEREADTMPNWAGSSWYFLRYTDPANDEAFASRRALDDWMPIDWYNGGMEHTTLHLLYSRFWHKFLYDCGYVPTKEPYRKRTSQGMILGANGEKMSKSRGNVVSPNDYIPEYGADAFRMYILFMGAFDQPIPWNNQGSKGCRRFLERVWRLLDMVSEGGDGGAEMRAKLHACIKKVGEDYESMKFNTAIAAMMALVNDFYAKGSLTKDELRTLLLLLLPVAPHIAEEINERLGFSPLYMASWPVYDEAALTVDTVEYGIQVNGKLRARLCLDAGLPAADVEQAALVCPEIAPSIDGKAVKKVFVVRNVVNIVVG